MTVISTFYFLDICIIIMSSLNGMFKSNIFERRSGVTLWTRKEMIDVSIANCISILLAGCYRLSERIDQIKQK